MAVRAQTHDKSRDDKRRDTIVQTIILLFLAFIIFVLATIAWFTMNKDTSAGGMGVKVSGLPFIIETRSGSGYYKDQYDMINYQAEEWKISSSHNFDNHSGSIEEDEVEPALEPGDFGSLEFRVSPQSMDTITVDCLFEIKAYLEETTTDEGDNEVTTITEISNSNLVRYLEGHILLFAGYDELTGKYTDLIDNNNESLQRILEDMTYTRGESTYTTIYWYWPEHLSDLTDSANTIYAPSEHEDVIAYVARNKDKFFKDCNDSETKVRNDLTSLYNTYSNQTYNYYNLKYDNADLVIGNNISYAMISMKVIND